MKVASGGACFRSGTWLENPTPVFPVAYGIRLDISFHNPRLLTVSAPGYIGKELSAGVESQGCGQSLLHHREATSCGGGADVASCCSTISRRVSYLTAPLK